MPLSDVAIRNAKPNEKPQRLLDGDGLFLLVNPNGSRWWRFRYRIGGREKLISLGTYPEVPLKTARERRDEARRLVRDGCDPSAKRQAERAARADTFEALAREWLEVQAKSLGARTFLKKTERFEAFVFPYLGKKPITEIKAPEMLAVLKRIEARGKHETAHRVRSECGNVFRYAVATGRAEQDPTIHLRGAIAAVSRKNRPAILDPARIGELMRAIDGYRGDVSTEFALKLLPLTFVRPGELRLAEWTEFDLNAAEWRIPAGRMKMRELHVVPLSRQAAALFKDIHTLTGDGRYVFPSLRSADRPISDNTINAALRRLGFRGDEMVGHGFRSMASTCLNEQGWHPDLIELQLAHAERNDSRGAYNRAQRLPERRKMMQAWANYLDKLRGKAETKDKTPALTAVADSEQEPRAA
jgi:integrase